jgi:hypothetical protein
MSTRPKKIRSYGKAAEMSNQSTLPPEKIAQLRMPFHSQNILAPD